MELIQLEQLVAISQEKVLSRAAKRLNISQPALSRSVQKLEDELGLTLFDRTKNKMTLNQAGAELVEQAKSVLSDVKKFLSVANALKNEGRHLHVASCAPAPLWKFSAELGVAFPKITLTSSMPDEEELVSILLSEKAELVIVRKEIESEAIVSVPLLSEQLFMQIPLSDPLSKKSAITFSDLAGKEIREYTNTGFWHKVHRQMIPAARYIEYDDIMVFMNAIRNTASLTFVTELAKTHEENLPGCVTVPITDKEATAHYRLAFLRKNESSLRDIVLWTTNAAKNW